MKCMRWSGVSSIGRGYRACACMGRKETKNDEASSKWHPCVCCFDARKAHEHIRVQLMRANGADSVSEIRCGLFRSSLEPTDYGGTDGDKDGCSCATARTSYDHIELTDALHTHKHTDTYARFGLTRTEFTLYRQFDINFWCWCSVFVYYYLPALEQ